MFLAQGALCLLLITRDEADRAIALLEDMREVVDEVVVVDSSSQSEHAKLAGRLSDFDHAHLLRLPPLGFAEPYRSYALGKACSEWVLMLDSDERINGELKADIKRIVTNTSATGLRILRQALFHMGDDRTQAGPSWPKTRLFKKSATRFFGFIHEQPTIYGVVETLPARYRMTHHVDGRTYWRKNRKYAKLSVFLKRWRYSDFMSRNTLKRASLRAYLLLRGRRVWEEVSPKELLLFKRLASPGIKKLTNRPSGDLLRKALLLVSLSAETRKFSFDVWSDIRLVGGATPYLGLDSQKAWENIALKQTSNALAAEDFFISLLVDEFYARNPKYEPQISKRDLILELNRAADKAFPETLLATPNSAVNGVG